MDIIALIVTMLLIDGTVTSQGYKAPLGTSVEQSQEEAESQHPARSHVMI